MPQNKQAFANAIAQSLGAEQPNRRPLIAMRGIRKSYYIGQPNELEILHGIDLTVWPGEFVAIVGESGSGKSTLMNIIGVLDKPTSGEYTLDGVDIHKADDDELAGIRNNKIGFVFQTYNLIGRHQSRYVTTRVASVQSPWMLRSNVGDLHTVPISHGEGRFLADEALIRQLAANGQIATQYVDLDGRATDDIHFNPNGSLFAVEGITSPDGRVFGKMGHAERTGAGLYKNVPGEYDMKMFTSAVRYFR